MRLVVILLMTQAPQILYTYTMLNREAVLQRLSDAVGLESRVQNGIVVNNNGCWIWQKYKDKRGYGVLGINGYPVRCHTVMWFLRHGTLPERGRHLDHLCNTTSCCNPIHLRDCAAQENISRAAMLITHCPKGHPYDAENTCVSGGNRYCRACAREKANRLGPAIYARLRDQGICVRCQRLPVELNRSMCSACLKKHAERNRKKTTQSTQDTASRIA